MLDGCHGALQKEYSGQQLVNGGQCHKGCKKLLEYQPYREVYNTICCNLNPKGSRKAGAGDPQDNTAEDTYDNDEFQRIMEALMGMDTSEAIRNMAMLLLMHMSVGRGDDARLFNIADIVKPRLLSCVGALTS